MRCTLSVLSHLREVSRSSERISKHFQNASLSIFRLVFQANGDEDQDENGYALEDGDVTSFYVVVVIADFVDIIVVLLFCAVVVEC